MMMDFVGARRSGSTNVYGDLLPQTIIDNNYNKGNMITSGYVYLEKGMHKFHMPYFEGHYDQKLELEWIVPETGTFTLVPAEAFYLAN